LTEGIHPGVQRLAHFLRGEKKPAGKSHLIEMERWGSPGSIWLEPGAAPFEATFSGWDALRILNGEIAEVFGYASGEAIGFDSPVLIGGRFENGELFRATFLPGYCDVRWRLAVIGRRGRAELDFPSGWPGVGILRLHEENGNWQEERWEDWNPWPILVEKFARAIAEKSNHMDGLAKPAAGEYPSWQDAIRCLELDDAARRSVERRRASTLEYQEATEEVGFKGMMTLIGCGMLWVMVLLVVLANWLPNLKLIVIPLLVLFLILQILRWFVPRKPKAKSVRHEA